MLRRAGLQALLALLELAQAPERWRSVTSIADAQQLPAPMLEQLLLQLRRSGLLEARRGRLGGYRLARSPAAITVAEVLHAVGADLGFTPNLEAHSDNGGEESRAERRVLQSMGQRLQAALQKEMQALSLEELLFDLSSWQESLSNEGGVMLG